MDSHAKLWTAINDYAKRGSDTSTHHVFKVDRALQEYVDDKRNRSFRADIHRRAQQAEGLSERLMRVCNDARDRVEGAKPNIAPMGIPGWLAEAVNVARRQAREANQQRDFWREQAEKSHRALLVADAALNGKGEHPEVLRLPELVCELESAMERASAALSVWRVR